MVKVVACWAGGGGEAARIGGDSIVEDGGKGDRVKEGELV